MNYSSISIRIVSLLSYQDFLFTQFLFELQF